jgi:hypothetical protein
MNRNPYVPLSGSGTSGADLALLLGDSFRSPISGRISVLGPEAAWAACRSPVRSRVSNGLNSCHTDKIINLLLGNLRCSEWMPLVRAYSNRCDLLEYLKTCSKS